jgi:putative photosynthetic complex assembly protein
VSTAAVRPILPAPLLTALGALLVLAIVAIGLSRAPFFGAGSASASNLLPALRSPVELQFADLDDGAVAVSIVQGGNTRLLDRLEPGTNGFARGLLRGLGRERKKLSLTMARPLVLGVGADRGLELHDPVTGSRLVLAAFGPTNEAVFSQLYRRAQAPQTGSEL